MRQSVPGGFPIIPTSRDSCAHAAERAHSVLQVDLHAAFVRFVANVVQIPLEMVHRYVVVHSHDRSLVVGPDAHYRIGVDLASNELLGLVLHGLVLVGQVVQRNRTALFSLPIQFRKSSSPIVVLFVTASYPRRVPVCFR